MEPDTLRDLLAAVQAGRLEIGAALSQLEAGAAGAAEEPRFRLDHQRPGRCGVPEAVFCPGKTPEDVAAIAREIVGQGGHLLATRATEAHADAVREAVPDAVWHPRARVVARRRPDAPLLAGSIAVVTAGTSDVPVAEEACLTAETFGSRVERFYDVGVAGVHRLLAVKEQLDRAAAVVVVAGMEGALASVVGGLVRPPIIGVPTSVGYGASFGGLAALLGMLNACAASVSVVNIDNGFGAGAIAHRINQALCARHPTSGEPG